MKVGDDVKCRNVRCRVIEIREDGLVILENKVIGRFSSHPSNVHPIETLDEQLPPIRRRDDGPILD